MGPYLVCGYLTLVTGELYAHSMRSLASTVFHHYVAADNASEAFASLKRIHGMMPYFMLKATLKISNPIAMIRSMCPVSTSSVSQTSM